MKHRIALTALAAIIPAFSVGPVALAGPSAEDRDGTTLSVTKHDKASDLDTDSGGNRGPRRVTNSIDLADLTYRIDRAAETLTVIYSTKQVLAPALLARFNQGFGTAVSADTSDPGILLWTWFTKRHPQGFLLVFRSSGDGRRCADATTVTNRKVDTVTQTVPFTCFNDTVDHGHLRSSSLVETRRYGGDISSDVAARTRDLPLSPAPTE